MTISARLCLLLIVSISSGQARNRSGRVHVAGSESCSKQEWDSKWLGTGTVPDKLARVPDSNLFMGYPGGFRIFPNQTLTTDQLLSRPYFKFPAAKPDALYTFLLEDNDIQGRPIKYFHWLVTNVPGRSVVNGGSLGAGEERLDYVVPFFIDAAEPGSGQVDHRYLMLAYEQPGRIQATERQAGCNADLLTPGRINDKNELAAKYNLKGPVAGNFFRVKNSGQYSLDMVCYFIKCTGRPFRQYTEKDCK